MHTPLNPGAAPSRLAHLDAVRGLAALIVLLAHVAGVRGYPLAPHIDRLFPQFDPGHLGVALFFLTSGYVIAISLEQSSFGDFWRRRFLRLYPTYWLSIALFLLVIVTNRGSPNSPQFLADPVPFLLANLTMVQPLFGADYMLIVYWTLTYELGFYALASLLHQARLLQHSVALCLGWMVFAGALDLASPQIGMGQAADPSLLALMLTGTVLYHVRQGRYRPMTGYLVVAACGAFFVLLTGATNGPANMLRAREAAILIFLLFFLFRWRPAALRWLGAISYPLYLFHFLVIALAGSHGFILDTLLWVGGSILLAWATHRWVERPLIQLGRSRRAGAPAGGAAGSVVQ